MKNLVKLTAVVVCMAAVMLTACGGNGANKSDNKASAASEKKQEASEKKTETVELNVAYMPNYCSLWSVENAINKGYLEEEGLQLTLLSSRTDLQS